MKNKTTKSNVVNPKKSSLAKDIEKLKDIIKYLEIEELSKEQLAKKLDVDVKSLTYAVFVAAGSIAENSNFLKNLKKEPAGPKRLGPQYVEGKGLLIPKWEFGERTITDKQKYRVEFNDETGAITLYPIRG